jgi:hypothetical protein
VAKGITKASQVIVKSEKVVEGVDKAAEGVKVAEKASNSGVKLLKQTERNFRENLMRLTGKSQESVKGMEAHHVLPQALEDKFKARFGNDFNINNPEWGAWVKQGEHQGWSSQYQKDWEKWLNENPKVTIEDVREQAEVFGEQYGFEVARGK